MTRSRPRFLPLRANVEWLKKSAKERLDELRARDPQSQLSDAQLEVARDYGFASWRKMVEHVESVRGKLQQILPPEDALARARVTPIAADDPGMAEFMGAIERGESAAVLKLLAARPGLATARDVEGRTPLHVAAQCNDPQLAIVLLAYGADPDAKYGASGHGALSWAVTCNAMEFATALVRLGAKIDLFGAAGIGALEEVRECFDEGGALREDAVRTGSSRYARDGTRLPCPPPTGRERIADALYIAARNGHVEVARFLLSKQTDVEFRAFMGAPLLHWAWFGGAKEIVEGLLAAGADPDARDDTLGATPRAFAICAPANWGFAWLVERKLDGDPSLAGFMDGRTSALHEAAKAGHLEVVKLLLARGALRELRDGEGKTALDRARERGHHEVAALLESG